MTSENISLAIKATVLIKIISCHVVSFAKVGALPLPKYYTTTLLHKKERL